MRWSRVGGMWLQEKKKQDSREIKGRQRLCAEESGDMVTECGEES